MNERIKELMDQAGIDVEAVENLGEMPTALKFAELIVRMCADAADMYEGKSDCVGDCVAEYMGYGAEEGITEWRAK